MFEVLRGADGAPPFDGPGVGLRDLEGLGMGIVGGSWTLPSEPIPATCSG
jgi:hypothetical protein